MFIEKNFMAKIYKIILFLLFFWVFPFGVNAANLYFSPPSGAYAAGGVFSATVYVSSSDQAMNAASGAISFPTDKLEVTSLSKTSSIFTLWVQEPSFSNNDGIVNFEGIVLNPGFIGANGKILTINFRVKAAGAASLNFSSGSALANDGKGTNILKGLGNAEFSLGGATPVESNTPKADIPSVSYGARLPAPAISSPTHPDSTLWYAKKDAKFAWPVSADITRDRLLVSKIPFATPTIAYAPAISEKEVANFEDGIWYFNVQLRNASGWGEVAHFKLQIDTEPPKPFEIKFIDGVKTENPKPTVVFDTTDSLSGIDYYKVKIGEGDFLSVASDIVKSNPYTLPLQVPGKRSILVQAFDKAGNYATTVEEFEILPIRPPSITEYPKEAQSGELVTVRGSTYSNSQVNIWLQREKDEPKKFTIQSNQDGKFTFTADEKLNDGVYKAWAEVIDARGAKSLPGEKITITVAKPAIVRIGTWATSLLVIIIPLVALILALLFVVWYGWHKFTLFRKRLQKEVREAESALHKSFDLLKENIREQVKMLEKTKTKRQLTEEEEKIVKQLSKNLDDTEKFVEKEIEDIEKTVK